MKSFLNKIIFRIKQLPRAVYNTFLCIRFPFLKLRDYKDIPMYPVLQWTTWYGGIPKGWRKAFGIQLCTELKKALKQCNYLKEYRITDVKEKYGTLQIYDCGAPGRDVRDIINKYDYISARTCIECGRPARYFTTGWLSPYCEDCIDEYRKSMAEEYYTDIPWYGWTSGDYYLKHKGNNEE